MSRVIWKYPVSVLGVTTVEMRAGARIVHVAAQDGQPCLWVECDPESLCLDERRFAVAMTGQVHVDVGEYVGTALLDGGAFVAHVYEVA